MVAVPSRYAVCKKHTERMSPYPPTVVAGELLIFVLCSCLKTGSSFVVVVVAVLRREFNFIVHSWGTGDLIEWTFNLSSLGCKWSSNGKGSRQRARDILGRANFCSCLDERTEHCESLSDDFL